jgi:hypothetical protein
LFPYFFFRAESDPAFDDPEQLRALLPRIAIEIEKANEAKQRQQQQNRQTNRNANNSNGSGGAPVTPNDPNQLIDETPLPPRSTKRQRLATVRLVAKVLLLHALEAAYCSTTDCESTGASY